MTSEPRWLDEEESRAWRAYLRMQTRLTAELNRQLQTASNLSWADYEVLVELTEAADGRLRPFQLQHRLDWEQSRLSHHLARMQKRDLVRREECDDDGRGAYVVLTDTGRQAITAAAPHHVAAVRRFFFDALDRGQVAALGALAGKVNERLQP